MAEHIEVPLYRSGVVAAYALLDAEDAHLARRRWRLDDKGYAVRTIWRGGKETILLHREVLGLAKGDGIQVDHRDRNPRNCRRSNLRVADYALNRQNLASYRGSSSRYRGVNWDKKLNKWLARAQVSGKQHHLGYFDEEEEAAAAASAFRAEHMPYSLDAMAV